VRIAARVCGLLTVQLGYKAFDIHELLCHFIARRCGLYNTEGLQVVLVDTNFVAAGDLPLRTFHAACGAALDAVLRGDDYKLVFIACDRPMFWLYGRSPMQNLDDLQARSVATFPDAAPPAGMLASVLAENGVGAELLPARDDISRLGLLLNGSVCGALLSSLLLPPQVLGRDAHLITYLGDQIRLPSTGLAVRGDLFDREPSLVATMCAVYREAMHRIYNDDDVLQCSLREDFNLPKALLDDSVSLVRSCYNRPGTSETGLLESAARRLAAQTGAGEPPPVGQWYAPG
jgi:hypothetical protein